MRPYDSIIPEYDKAIITKAFAMRGEDNIKCIILIITNTYNMGIDNPDIYLVI